MQSDDSDSTHLSALYPETVLSFVKDTFRKDAQPLSIERVSHGEWSKAFFVRYADAREYVIRFTLRDQDFLKDQLAMRFASPRLPMPKQLEIGRAFDGYYAISERAYGDFIENRDQAAMLRLLPSLFDALDACREADVSATSGFGLWGSNGIAHIRAGAMRC